MTATLGKILVLNLNRARPSALKQAHGAADVERVAVAGIRVDDQIGANAIVNHGERLEHLAHAHEPEVRSAEPRVGDRCTGDVKRGEAGLLRDQRGECVVDAGSDDDRPSPEADAQGYHVSCRHNPR